MSNVTELLAELDPLPYPERVRSLARRGRALAADPRSAADVADLRTGGAYERSLALTMAVVAGHAELVLPAVGDPDPQISANAISACLRAGWLTPRSVVELVGELPADARRAVYRWLRTMRRAEYADALVDAIRVRFGDIEAARVLPACSAGTVARLLPELEHAVASWRALGVRHPDVVIEYATEALGRLRPAARGRWWSRDGGGVLAARQVVPHRVLDVLERFAPASYLPGDLVDYGVLAAADPVRVLRLLTAPARASWLSRSWLPAALLDRFGRLDPPELLPLGQRLRRNEAALARLLDAMPPSRRGPFHDAVMADVDTSQAVLGEVIMEVLPWRWREREARRILGLARVRDDEAATLRFAGYLPWAEAAPALAAATRRAEAEDRAVAYELLVAAALRSRDPAAVASVVAQLAGLRNEQDPVRARALVALSSAARLVEAGSVAGLAAIVTDTSQARDASSASLSALRGLAVSVVQQHHDDPDLLRWALQTFERLFQGHHLPPLGRLDTTLRRDQEQQLFGAVRSWIEAGMARGRYEPLFAVTRALGRRAWRLPELQELVRRAIRPGTVSSVLTQAVTLWLADPTSRGDRVAEVLATDSSTVTLGPVWQAICGRRTDLLDSVLLGGGPSGRLLTAGVRWVPGQAYRIDRWLPRQRQAYADLQAKVAADAGATLWARVAAIAAVARVPSHGWPILERYLDSANTNLAEAAIAGLAWTDRPADALPRLLAHADGDRARVAIYAASRAARFVPPARLTGLLPPIAGGRGKLTSRKEALRLLARLGPPEAMETLASAWRQDGQHRDVRATIAAAATRRLEVATSWEIVEAAARGSREEMRAVLARPAAMVAERDRSRYAALVVAICGSADRVASRTAWTMLTGWTPWAPELAPTVTAAASDLDDHSGWPGVATAVAVLLDHRPVLDAVLVELVRLDTADEDPGGPARDRPARRRIDTLVDRVTGWADRADPDNDRGPVREAARWLAQQPAFVPQAARLLLHLARLDAADPAEPVSDLTEVGQLAADRPVLAGALAARLRRALRTRSGSWHTSTVLATAAVLAGGSDPAAGLLAVALAGAGAEQGWTPQWREVVHRLRRHPAADVRCAALDLDMTATDLPFGDGVR
jgi:hypothetical protein